MDSRQQIIINRGIVLVGLGLVTLTVLSIFVYGISTNSFSVGYNDGYKPTQPIPFSHKLHAGNNQINCKYCHTGVERSRHATIPSLDICMNCHLSVKTNSPIIQKITEKYKKGESIEWQKVHLVPDFVKFNHAPHVNSGVSCTTCHGEVEKMDVVHQVKSMSMGFCVNCHRNYDNMKNKLPESKKQDSSNKPSINCSTCHY